ncbi:MAG: carboxypeptidase regulatory-like domain-containing protein [Nocardioidaceae bacterium]|nr:MAG: carboxypeptidase regulatory-like domain-containing protein [Nocardioidaceae bacterium]
MRRVWRVLAVGSALTLALTLAPAHAASSRWSGYAIPGGKRADAGFVGAYLTGKAVTYRVDPAAKKRSARYKPARAVSGPPNTARAAWVLSKYGAVRIADQAAAVDVVTHALLGGQSLGSKRTKKRLAATGRAKQIRALAKTMLADSKLYAGPYRMELKTKPATVGGTMRLHVIVRAASGKPAPKLAITAVGAGTAARAVTDSKGSVRFGFDAVEPGYVRVRVKAAGVPSHRVTMREPKTKGATRLAVAGKKRALKATVRLATQVVPRTAVVAAAAAEVGKPVRTKFTLSNSADSAARLATLRLFGPYSQAVTPDCTATPFAQATATVTANGTYSTPDFSVKRAGWYYWGSTIAGSGLNTPTSTCGGSGAVRTRATLSTDVQPNGRLKFSVAKTAPGYQQTATIRIYGPYKKKANIGCGQARLKKTQKVLIKGNGKYRTPKVTLSAEGAKVWYAWRVTLPKDPLTIELTSKCKAPGSMLKVKKN